MERLEGTVVSVHAGDNADLSKNEKPSITVELDGIVGDRHRGPSRRCWAGDKQAQGTLRRNDMELAEPLNAAELGANLCISGIAQLSRLPKGSVLKFPSGAELVVVEYNPPCHGMGKQLAATHKTNAGEALASTAFSKAAKLKRGVLGIVDVPGTISAGDTVEVEVYEHPAWLERTAFE